MDKQVIVAKTGMVTVHMTLYGEVTPERAEREGAIANHRANQLSKVGAIMPTKE